MNESKVKIICYLSHDITSEEINIILDKNGKCTEARPRNSREQ